MTPARKEKIVWGCRIAALCAVTLALVIGLFIPYESFKPHDSVWRTLMNLSLWVMGICMAVLLEISRRSKKLSGAAKSSRDE